MNQLFVRWFKDEHADYGGAQVELVLNEEVIQSDYCGTDDRVYGYCRGVVSTLKRIGVLIEMPICLQGHLGPDKTRED